MDWQQSVLAEVYHFLFVFARLGGAFLFMPFYVSTYIPRKIRLIFALGLAVVLTPLLQDELPAPSNNALLLFKGILIEITVGVFLGVFPYFLMTAIDLIGVNVSMATSFSNATLLDPQTKVQSTVLTAFLNLCALLLIVVTGLHHVMIGAVVESYQVFPVNQALFTEDMLQMLTTTLGSAFKYGFQIGSPFIVMVVLMYSAMGVMSRLMPQLNIIFIVMPLQVYLGLALLMISFPMMMWWFLAFFQESMYQFIK